MEGLDKNNTCPLFINEEEHQYEFRIGKAVAYVRYKKENNVLFLTHTVVPQQLSGKGIGSALVKQVLTRIKKENTTIVPQCSFIASYIERHPEWQSLLLKQ